MKLTNEPLLIRTFIGALLALLVAFGVRLSGTQIDAIVAFSDIAITLAGALVGALSSRSKVDGPETAKGKDAEIYRLQALLEKHVVVPPSSKKPPPISSLLVLFLLIGCSGAPPPCAKYGSLEAEYYAALEQACGELTEQECLHQKPGAVEGVDERFQPKFLEAEKCQR